MTTLKAAPDRIHLNRKITPQAALVLDYLTAGRKLTPLIAHSTLGVASITARVAELRKAGVGIERQFKHDHIGRKYAEYKLK